MRDNNVKPSEAKLNDSVRCAKLDEDLYFLTTLSSGRSSLKRALLETYTSLSEDEIDELSESMDNTVDYSASAMSEYEKILSQRNEDKAAEASGADNELISQFRRFNKDVQIELNLQYYSYLKKHRSEREVFKEMEQPTAKEESKPIDESCNGINRVRKGDAIRWNYTKEEGVVIGFERDEEISNIIVRRYNGTKVLFENDPKLFTILEGEEREKVIERRNQYVAEIRARKDIGRKLIPKKSKRQGKTIYDGVVYDEPTRRGSKLRVGDHIRFKQTKDVGVVSGFIRRGGVDRMLLVGGDGIPNEIIDNPEAYDVVI